MRLEHLFDMEYRSSESLEKVDPDAFGDGLAYSVGASRIFGPRVTGTARWANSPRIRADGRFLPSCRGAIRTDDGYLVLFEMQGIGVMPRQEGSPPGAVHVLRFRTSAQPYLWLNDATVIGEGEGSPQGDTLVMRFYECVRDWEPDFSLFTRQS